MTTPRDDIDGLIERLKAWDDADLSFLDYEPTVQSLQRTCGEAATQLAALSARVKELEALVYVPGSWHCPKCKFTLLQSNLNAQDGTVTARDTPGDKCPNCTGPLWRCSWKNDAFEMQERAVEQMDRAKAAESRATRLQQERDEALSKSNIIKNMDETALIGLVMTLTGGSSNPDVVREQIARIRQLAAGNEKEKNE